MPFIREPILLSPHEQAKLPAQLAGKDLYVVRDLGGYVEVSDDTELFKTTIDKDRVVYVSQVCSLCHKPRGYCDDCPVRCIK